MELEKAGQEEACDLLAVREFSYCARASRQIKSSGSAVTGTEAEDDEYEEDDAVEAQEGLKIINSFHSITSKQFSVREHYK